MGPKILKGYGGVTPGKTLNFQVEIKPSPAISGNVTYKYWVVNEAFLYSNVNLL